MVNRISFVIPSNLFVSSTRVTKPLLVGSIFLAGVGFLLPQTAWAQQVEPKVAVPKTTAAPQIKLDLEREATLQKQVSFEVKQCPLPELLADLQEQSGVTLQLGQEAKLEDKRVTARVQKLPLAKVMESLGHLYSFIWTRGNEGYQLSQPVIPLEAIAVPLGDLEWFGYWKNSLRQPLAPKELDFAGRTDWTAEILKLAPVAELNLKDGLPVTS
ncbi:MAG: hypothetical protein EOP09_20300, partial [Proteobacteria bacterium]